MPRIPNDGQFWNVTWDGMKKVQQFHKDFIEVVETHDQEKLGLDTHEAHA